MAVGSSAAAYGVNPNHAVNVNEDHGWGGFQYPGGVPARLLGQAQHVNQWGDNVRVTVRSALTDLFAVAFAIADRLGYRIYVRSPDGSGEPWGPWSYENRAVGGTNGRVPSNHSRGKAIDVNAPHNPQSTTFHTDFPIELVQIWERMGLCWGGRYRPPTRYDTMHWEYGYSPGNVPGHVQYGRNELNRLSGHPSTPTTPPPTPNPITPPFPLPSGYYYGPLSGPKESISGMAGERQAWVDGLATAQRRLNAHLTGSGAQPIGVDGKYGPKTAGAIRWYQTARHGAPFNLAVDGLIGPKTWNSLWQ